jgi:hypothetical protein
MGRLKMFEVRDITVVEECVCGNIYHNDDYVVGMYITKCALLRDGYTCDDEIYKVFKHYAYNELESVIFAESFTTNANNQDDLINK